MNPDSPEALAALREVQHAAQQRDIGRAATLAQAALASGLEHPLLYNVLSLHLEQQGLVAQAAQLLGRGVARAPRDGGLRNALGLCLLRLGQPGPALAQFDELLRLSPDLPFAHASRGSSLLAMGRLGAAEDSYRRSLELDPGQPVAMAGLAHIAIRRGQHPEADRLARQALTVLPGFPDAVVSLAAAELAQGAAAAAESRLLALLNDAAPLDVLDRAQAQGLLGDALDAQGHAADAFAAYSAGNQALRHYYAASFADSGALAYVAGLTAQLQDLSPRWRATPLPATDGLRDRAPLFLLGFPRSGTTLMEVALEGDERVRSPGEHEFLADAVGEFMRSPADLVRLLQAPPSQLARLQAAYWNRAAESDAAGGILLDKYPLNTLKLPLIERIFPAAKVIFLYRDPRDVVLSCFRRRFQMSAPMYQLLTLEGAARYYDAVMRFWQCCRDTLRLSMCLVHYESLVVDFDAQMKTICEFAGVEWSSAMYDFAARTRRRATATPSIAQLTGGLNRDGIGVWRRYRTQLAAVEPILRPWIERFGYPAE